MKRHALRDTLKFFRLSLFMTQSLRYQINVRILLLSLLVLLSAGTIAVWQARTAVNNEVQSSVQLAVKLVYFGFTHTKQHPADWLPQLNALEETRHLAIQLQLPSGELLNIKPEVITEQPPEWFIQLIQGQTINITRVLILPDGKQLLLTIQANPINEISEVWQENMAFFIAVCSLTVLSFFAVNLVFKKALKSISTIVSALNVIANGHYQEKLPEFSIAEYASIANAINQLADKLSVAKQENRALTQHSLEIQEDERKKLAQELHDELGQSLTAIKVMAVAATRRNADIQQCSNTIVNTCNHLMQVVRSMMHQLHPLVLTELGLKAGLEDLIAHWAIRANQLEIQLDCSSDTEQLSANIAIQVFRIVQECLTNIVRHAQANTAHIELSIAQQVLLLKVSDNGIGCQEVSKTGFGLLGMKERVHSLGGEFSLHSQQGLGTRISVRIPLT